MHANLISNLRYKETVSFLLNENQQNRPRHLIFNQNQNSKPSKYLTSMPFSHTKQNNKNPTLHLNIYNALILLIIHVEVKYSNCEIAFSSNSDCVLLFQSCIFAHWCPLFNFQDFFVYNVKGRKRREGKAFKGVTQMSIKWAEIHEISGSNPSRDKNMMDRVTWQADGR